MEVVKSQNQNQSKRVLESVLGMKGGHGDSSYAKNSSVQLMMVEAAKPILERGIYENLRLKLNGGGIVRIADLGCGTGWNTLLIVDTIVKAVQSSLEEGNMPEFQVYFNDLPSNDFNLLFQMLPPHRQNSGDADGRKKPVATRSYFAAAVCGSYFKRLFPRKSLHFCHSSFSLHYLSRVPESVQQKNSPRVYISSDCEKAVGAAYLKQFDSDMTAFLSARAEEIVGGGCMFTLQVGRKAGSHIMEEQGRLGNMSRHLEYAFEELVNEGIITKEKWESFNMPWFASNSEEVESIVKKEGSFDIKSVRVLEGFPLHSITHVKRGEEEMFGRSEGNRYRAMFENIVDTHLGSERLTNEFFSRIARRATAKFEEYLHDQVDLVIAFLVRKEE